MFRIVVFVLPFFFMTPALYAQTYDECMDKSGGVTSKMRDCSGAEYERLTDEIEKSYKKLIAKCNAVKAQNTDQLLSIINKSQTAWVRYMQASCDLAAASEIGHTMWYLIIDGCHIDAAKKRVEELNGYYEGELCVER